MHLRFPFSRWLRSPNSRAVKPVGLLAMGFLAALLAWIGVVKEHALAEERIEGTKVVVKRFHQLDAEELRKELSLAPEVGLDAVPQTSAKMVLAAAQCRLNGEAYLGPALLMNDRPDLAGLPIMAGLESMLAKEPAEDLQAMSRKLRVAIESCIPKDGDPRPDPERLRKLLLDEEKKWLKSEAVPCLLQMLQAENSTVRKIMVEVLSKIDGRRATAALAMRAMTDLAPEVREAAVLALKARPSEDYRVLLLAGLRYPWTGVVAHAAEALTALEGKEAGPALIKALQEPDPNLPVTLRQGKKEMHLVREVVRVNHLANCVLCHAPSFDRGDMVRGAVPIPGQPLPGPATTPQYYESGESFVRADVTFLRQDFSVVQPVLRAGQWPSNQRFDYLVRLRLVSKKELEKFEALKLKPMTPRIDVLIRAVREATGTDPGSTPEEWKKIATADDLRTPSEKAQRTLEKDWRQFLPMKGFPEVRR